MENHDIRADVSLEVNYFLSVNGYIYGESISLSLISITHIRQIETMFTEITLKLSSSHQKKQVKIAFVFFTCLHARKVLLLFWPGKRLLYLP